MGQSSAQQYKEGSSALFYRVLVLIIIAIFFALFGTKVFNLLESVATVNNEKSVAEFKQSINAIRSKWLTEKREFVELSLSDTPDLKAKGILRFFVNQQGYPLGLNKEQLNCKALWINMQSQPWQKVHKVKVELNSQGEPTSCRYYGIEREMFSYDSSSGKVNLVN
ncbi:hypothetical protein ORJ66_06865 [Pseudoalteromonas tunicata]|uniref:hypothetical protein n=1 Tax=Pseudoalteromonas tunicata TaxID=314281 RepID=UPI00273E721A|nr:hypothetical protein [Pseudoalteromonas tunicata]MDP5212763.1 hypothetical protein [Pseudoalteromonas tunicata]